MSDLGDRSPQSLTELEAKVLGLVIADKDASEITAELGISSKTFKNVISNIIWKLGPPAHRQQLRRWPPPPADETGVREPRRPIKPSRGGAAAAELPYGLDELGRPDTGQGPFLAA